MSFNLLPELGEAVKVKLGATEQRIRRHYSGQLYPLDLVQHEALDGLG